MIYRNHALPPTWEITHDEYPGNVYTFRRHLALGGEAVVTIDRGSNGYDIHVFAEVRTSNLMKTCVGNALTLPATLQLAYDECTQWEHDLTRHYPEPI